jgi:hypothetical protein
MSPITKYQCTQGMSSGVKIVCLLQKSFHVVSFKVGNNTASTAPL